MLTARPELGACRILGHDKVLVEAIERGLIDAVISGPTGVVPEATVELFGTHAVGDKEAFDKAAALFREALGRMETLPYPWALKVIAEQRGLFPAQLPFPPGEERERELDALRAWLPGWLDKL
jgi:dihydrodipicolinate synthase/N-acetylneuraminate lyase